MQNKENALLEDTILSKMPPPYRVQINDILSIRIKVLDQEKCRWRFAWLNYPNIS